MRLHDIKSRANAPRLRTLLVATDHCKTYNGMTLLDISHFQFVSGDAGLIVLPRYFPLAQFTKARPVDSLGSFQLSIPSKQVLSWLKTASDPQLCCAYNYKCNDEFESLRDSSSPPGTRGATEKGVTPRLLHVSIPGAYEDSRPTRSIDGPGLTHYQRRRRSLQLTWKA